MKIIRAFLFFFAAIGIARSAVAAEPVGAQLRFRTLLHGIAQSGLFQTK